MHLENCSATFYVVKHPIQSSYPHCQMAPLAICVCFSGENIGHPV